MDNHPEILLVEDDDFAAEIVSAILGPDCGLHRVANGHAALDFMALQKPALVLLDVSMPGMTGYEVCRKLRDDSTNDGLPIIFLSGMVSEEERLAGYEAGGDDYLTKPVAAVELRYKIDLAPRKYEERGAPQLEGRSRQHVFHGNERNVDGGRGRRRAKVPAV